MSQRGPPFAQKIYCLHSLPSAIVHNTQDIIFSVLSRSGGHDRLVLPSLCTMVVIVDVYRMPLPPISSWCFAPCVTLVIESDKLTLLVQIRETKELHKFSAASKANAGFVLVWDDHATNELVGDWSDCVWTAEQLWNIGNQLR